MAITIKELLDAGAHFGHQTHRWNPKMRSYIYGARNGIYIVDLQQTAKLWARGRQAIIDTVARGERVMFVGTKQQAQEVINEEAGRCGQFFVNRRWLGGMLTNFKTIKGRLDRLDQIEAMKTSDQFTRIPKKEQVAMEKERQKLEKGLFGIRHMTKLPGLIIVVDPNKEHISISEAHKLQIPILAITDTNCDPDGIDYMIPANDDALKSIRLFMHDAAEACIEGKRVFEARIQEETRRKAEAAENAKAAQSDNSSQVASGEPATSHEMAMGSEPVAIG